LIPDDLWSIYGTFFVQTAKQPINNAAPRWIQIRDCAACDAQKLAKFCAMPTVLIVENRQTDGGWIKTIIKKLKPALAYAITDRYNALDIRTGGGAGEIPKELKDIATYYRSIRPSDSMPLRVLALTDSDAILPGHPSAAALQIAQAAGEVGAAAHILQKRTIENYIPDDSLYQYAALRRDRAAAVDLITSLTGHARDHYPLKDGLKESEIDAADNIYPPSMPLEVGMGDFIRDFLESFGYRLDPNRLRQRDGDDELDRLLTLLEENL
jgi:hypothetical protein